MKVQYPHSHSKEEVYEIFNSYFDSVRERKMRHGEITEAECTWNSTRDVVDITVYAMGNSRSGQVIIEDKQVIVKGKLPIIAIPFRNQIKQQIIKKLEDLL